MIQSYGYAATLLVNRSGPQVLSNEARKPAGLAYWSRTATRFLLYPRVKASLFLHGRNCTARDHFQVVEPVRSTPEILPRESAGSFQSPFRSLLFPPRQFSPRAVTRTRELSSFREFAKFAQRTRAKFNSIRFTFQRVI